MQAAFNYERMLSLGYCLCLIPFIKKAFASSEDRADFLKRNLDFFNTHPYMAGWIIGAAIKLEEQSLETGQPDTQQIDRFKRRMSESLGAIGDQLFWGKIRPLAAMIGLAVALFYPWLGLGLFLFLYNLPHLYMRVKGVVSGYKRGFDLVKYASLKKYDRLFESLDKFAAFGVGLYLGLGSLSDMVNGTIESFAFLGGVFFMFVLLKLKVSIPISLITLILGSAIIGGMIE